MSSPPDGEETLPCVDFIAKSSISSSKPCGFVHPVETKKLRLLSYCNWPSLLIHLQVLKCLVPQLADKMPKIAHWACHNWRRTFPVCFAMHGSSGKSVIRHPQRVWCSAHPDLTPSILFRNALFNHSNIHTRVLQWFHVLSCHQIILIQN